MRLVRRRSAHPTEVADPGVQGERTYLAWQRTGLSFAAIGAALVHLGGPGDQRVAGVTGLFGIAAGALLLGGAMPRYRHSVPAARGEHRTATPLLVLTTAVSAVLLGVGALLVVFWGTAS